jgi:hypothetical protein
MAFASAVASMLTVTGGALVTLTGTGVVLLIVTLVTGLAMVIGLVTTTRSGGPFPSAVAASALNVRAIARLVASRFLTVQLRGLVNIVFSGDRFFQRDFFGFGKKVSSGIWLRPKISGAVASNTRDASRPRPGVRIPTSIGGG